VNGRDPVLVNKLIRRKNHGARVAGVVAADGLRECLDEPWGQAGCAGGHEVLEAVEEGCARSLAMEAEHAEGIAEQLAGRVLLDDGGGVMIGAGRVRVGMEIAEDGCGPVEPDQCREWRITPISRMGPLCLLPQYGILAFQVLVLILGNCDLDNRRWIDAVPPGVDAVCTRLVACALDATHIAAVAATFLAR